MMLSPFRVVAILFFLSSLMLLASCSDDDPPITIPEAQISSPDELMEAFTFAINDRDIEALVPLLDHYSERFSFNFRDEDVDELSLPTGYLNLGDMIQVWRNIFSGQEILNDEDQMVPGIVGIEVIRFERNTEWRGYECGTNSWWDIAFNLQRVNFRVEFTITRAGGYPPLYIDGNLEVRVRPPCREATFASDCEGYALFSIEDGSWEYEREGLITFGKFAYQYFTNEAPEVELTVEVNETNPQLVEGIACETRDSGVQMLDGIFRWRFHPDAVWTVWSEDCSSSFEYSTLGEKTIEVEVQDRWGLTTREQITIELTKPRD